MMSIDFVLGVTSFLMGVFVTNYILRSRILSPTNKAVLITGCDRGFGALLAVKLAFKGYRVFAGCLDAAGLGAARLRETALGINVIQLDVTSDQQVAEARELIEAELDDHGLWAVVNNAGVATFAEAEWCPLSTYQTMMDINWLGTVRVTKAFLPLVRAKRGRIINVASLAGRVALPAFSCYSSSKFAVVGFSECLRREMFKFGVKVITIEPSMYRTSLLDTEALIDQLEHMWDTVSQEVRDCYGVAYLRAFFTGIERMMRYASTNLDEVVNDLAHAVEADYPYTRYVPCLFANHLPTDLFSASPNQFQDMVLNGLFRVPVLPRAVRHQTGRRTD